MHFLKVLNYYIYKKNNFLKLKKKKKNLFRLGVSSFFMLLYDSFRSLALADTGWLLCYQLTVFSR